MSLPRLFLALILSLVTALPALAFDTRARAAWVYDVTTHTVLLDKNAHEPLPPASMSKLMTLNMLFEALRDGRVTMETTFAVSTKAKQMGGSKMFVEERDRPTVEELIHGIIVNSGNDACVVVAEGLNGTESDFARAMTVRAKALGMTDSTFTNSSGWPDPGHRMSVHDLGILAVRLIEEFPEFYPYFSHTEFNYKDRVPSNANNRNPLLRLGPNGDWTADGLKTGHTQEAGYGLVGSAVQKDGRRIVFVLTGLATEADRAQEGEQIVNWAFRQFVQKTLVTKGQRVTEADVWLGNASRVGLVPAEDVKLLVPALVQDNVTAEVSYTGPLRAPIAAGQELAELVIHVPDLPDTRVPLVAEGSIGSGGLQVRLMTAAKVLYRRFMEEAPAT
ncbi:D-alanyl-D-alanine carboxypeptidase [Rhodobacter sphaeroides]|uniref:serine-type D-Ala-D-Ala carboxypeptidase n=2 Tax=Cereibacter TaxID=1653176 RepID=Q3J0G2_CERS4|nr:MULTISPECIES: D-alanyl-D-alanine carboxypeptidase family protein [Cereibacter]EKX59595.1 D-alanyl-D-alanine carboxypeptidase [Rhodobacter sp. AKP1]RDS97487.1 D-alanyl-D-alanine carboxypeptidase [Cereibacter sphaeroides f. sp. denitrificans]ABA79722.2 putative D-alanyl-D-alanine carboxypeptidase [Cereibacter sphaeroides 2.4.1]AMJ48007.1 D-alanyl-D-alanine carboxypeptidase [Cereibacter sphaeroides]ANS34716.1 D-alanyl-D-alanine carboxypeptidase [Cereibacter sphaeroides]